MLVKRIVIVGNDIKSMLMFRSEWIKQLVDNGFSVSILAPSSNSTDSELFRALGAELINTPLKSTGLNPLEDLKTFLKLYRLIKQIAPDMVISYTIKPAIYASIAASLAGVKQVYSVITGLGYVFIGSSIKVRALRVLVKQLYRFALKGNKKVLFLNDSDAEYFLSQRLIRSSQLVVIPGEGVNLDSFNQVALPERPVFLMIARLLVDKGVREYIAAAKQVKALYANAEFLLVGGVSNNPAAIPLNEVLAAQSKGTITYIGEVNDVRPYIEKAAVFVLPSYREGMPRSVLEAMAMGRPIIVSDAPGCRQTVEPGVNGYLVPVKNVSYLTEAMCELIEKPELMQKMAEASRRLAKDKYDVQVVNAHISIAMDL